MQLQRDDITAVLRAIAAKLGEPIGAVRKSYWFDPFTFTTNFVTPNQLAASATATLNFVAQNDSAFVICKTTYLITDTANAMIAEAQPFGSGLTTGGVRILVTLNDSGSGRSLMDSGVPIDSLFGTAQRPYCWAAPKVLDPNSTFSTTLQNLVATAYHVRLAYHGYKVFGNIEAWAKTNKQ